MKKFSDFAPEIISLNILSERIPDNALLSIPAEASGSPMSVVRELVRRGARDLQLFSLPTNGIEADILIGAGCVKQIETAGVTLGEYGRASRFCEAVETGAVEIRDSTCPALHAQLIAGEKGIPFMPLRGLIGSDIARFQPDWHIIDNPFIDKKDEIMLLPAVQPDVAVFHSPKADRNGNIWIGRYRELGTIARAAHKCLVTVEEISDEDFFETEATAAGALAALYIDSVAIAPFGANPCGLHDLYPLQPDYLRNYASASRTQQGFNDWLQGFLSHDQIEAA